MFCAASLTTYSENREQVQNSISLPKHIYRKNKKYCHHVKLSLNLSPDTNRLHDSKQTFSTLVAFSLQYGL